MTQLAALKYFRGQLLCPVTQGAALIEAIYLSVGIFAPTVSIRSPVHAASVVGSIIFRTSVILVAGKPLISACRRMMSSSLAR